jgi:predicted MFS family arabinose efflux permease
MAFALSQTMGQAVSARLAVGLFASILVPGLALLARWFEPERYARAMSVFMMAGVLGSILAAPPTVWLSTHFGWRGAILIPAVLLLPLVAAFWLGIPERAPTVPNKQLRPAQPILGEVVRGIIEVVTNKRFWPLCLWHMTVTGTLFMLVALWIVPYMVERVGMTTMQAAMFLMLCGVGKAAMQPVVAFSSDLLFKSRRKPLLIISTLILILSAIWTFGQSSLPDLAIVILVGVFITLGSGGGAMLMVMIKETFPPQRTGTALGCFNMLYPIWTGIMQMAFGLLYAWGLDRGQDSTTAFGPAIWLILLNVMVAFVCALMTKETFPQSTKTPVKTDTALSGQAN